MLKLISSLFSYLKKEKKIQVISEIFFSYLNKAKKIQVTLEIALSYLKKGKKIHVLSGVLFLFLIIILFSIKGPFDSKQNDKKIISTELDGKKNYESENLSKNNEVEIYPSNNSFFKYKKRSSILNLIKKAESYGAGEIVLQCINREGQQNGLDLDLIKEISTSTQLPIISSCGMKNLTDARNAFRVGADGVMASKFFSLYGKCDGVLLTYPTYEEIELLK